MWLYYLLKTISTLVSWLPYKLVVNIGIGIGHLYHTIAKKQRIRAEETIKERLCEIRHNFYGNNVYASTK